MEHTGVVNAEIVDDVELLLRSSRFFFEFQKLIHV